MTKLIFYPILNLRSQRAMIRKTKRWGWLYFYEPKPQLVKRLAYEFNMSEDAVRQQLQEERRFILKYNQYY